MKFTDTQVSADSSTKIPAEATGGAKGYTTPAAIATAMPADALTIAKVSGLQAILDSLTSRYANFKIVNTKSDFPAPVANVITLDGDFTYLVTGAVDLTGDRLVTSGVNALVGFSSEISFITSSGLGNNIPLLSTEHTISIKNITFHDVHTCLDVDGTMNSVALDWEYVNFVDIPNVGIIDTCNNFILNTSAFLGSQGLVLTGTIGTVGIINSILRGIATAGNILRLDDAAIITRRFRTIFSSVIVPSMSTGISVSELATVPVEGYILDTVNFSGAGTFVSGVSYTSEKALFMNSVGVINTTAIANMWMKSNAVPTPITTPGNRYAVLGTSDSDGYNQKFTHILARNSMRYDSIIPRLFRIQCTFSVTGATNNILGFYIGVKKGGGALDPDGDFLSESEMYVTANGARPELGTVQGLVLLEPNDEVYLITENSSGTAAVTVQYLNIIIERTN